MNKIINCLIIMLITVPLFAQFKGGEGDGFAFRAGNFWLNGNSVVGLYTGGTGDGFAAKGIAAYTNGNSLDGLYTGGAGDGFAFRIGNFWLNGNTVVGLYTGGTGDGFAVKNIEGYVSGSSLQGLYTGGSGDGFARSTSFLTPLPIQLLSFDATAKETYVLIKWVTASEKNNSFFTIERSQNGILFKDLKTVPGQGTTQSVHVYTENDNDPLTGRSFYRLKWTDFDGRSEYSDVRSVFFKQENKKDFLLFPNPNDGNIINVQLDGIATNENISVSIADMQGRIIYQSQKPTISSNRLVINLTQQLLKGSYVVQVVRNGESSAKVLIVR